MDRNTSSLLLKSNRILGTRLVETDLVNLSQLEAANEVFIERVRQKDLRRSSILRILVYEQQSLDEDVLIDHQLTQHRIGGMLLDSCRPSPEVLGGIHPEWCVATWTLPIDRVANTYFLASAYYLSDVVRAFWAEKLEGMEMIWYVTPIIQLESAFDERFGSVLDGEREKAG